MFESFKAMTRLRLRLIGIQWIKFKCLRLEDIKIDTSGQKLKIILAFILQPHLSYLIECVWRSPEQAELFSFHSNLWSKLCTSYLGTKNSCQIQLWEASRGRYMYWILRMILNISVEWSEIFERVHIKELRQRSISG